MNAMEEDDDTSTQVSQDLHTQDDDEDLDGSITADDEEEEAAASHTTNNAMIEAATPPKPPLPAAEAPMEVDTATQEDNDDQSESDNSTDIDESIGHTATAAATAAIVTNTVAAAAAIAAPVNDESVTTTPKQSSKHSIHHTSTSLILHPHTKAPCIAVPTMKHTHKQALDRSAAIEHARNLLLMEVPALPAMIGGSKHALVTNFGTIPLLPSGVYNPYVGTKHLYSKGFSCVKYEFSPVHGRVIPLKCQIIEGPLFTISWGSTSTTQTRA